MYNSTIPFNCDARPVEIEMIRKMVQEPAAKKLKTVEEPEQSLADEGSAFIIKPADQWLKSVEKKPEAEKLFGSFWFEHELCIMFADTNVGKSILAVQIADSISRGQQIVNFKMRAQVGTVLYYDFELTAPQFLKRYSGGVYGQYQFNSRFLRGVLNPFGRGEQRFDTYADYIIHEIENNLITTKAKFLIIDNITCISNGTQSGNGSLNLMRRLQHLKRLYSLSIMVLAHTPKRNPTKPITQNDLQGSKMLINFADSAFAIGESRSAPTLRYLKQIKQRSTTQQYGADNVCLCRITKPFNFLQFDFEGNGTEAEHLLHDTQKYRQQQEAEIIRLHQQAQSLRQIAAQLGISNSTVMRTLKRIENKTVDFVD